MVGFLCEWNDWCKYVGGWFSNVRFKKMKSLKFLINYVNKSLEAILDWRGQIFGDGPMKRERWGDGSTAGDWMSAIK